MNIANISSTINNNAVDKLNEVNINSLSNTRLLIGIPISVINCIILNTELIAIFMYTTKLIPISVYIHTNNLLISLSRSVSNINANIRLPVTANTPTILILEASTTSEISMINTMNIVFKHTDDEINSMLNSTNFVIAIITYPVESATMLSITG